jgi:hypothetical protein
MVVLTVCVIWGNSILPASVSGAISGGLKDWINSLLGIAGGELEGDGGLRKVAHFAEFAVLGSELTLLFAYKYMGSGERSVKFPEKIELPFVFEISKKVALLLALGYGTALIDETIQLFSDGRASLRQDVLLDFAGYCAGMCVVSLVLFLKGVWNRKKNIEL